MSQSTLRVPLENKAERLDKFLTGHFSDFSRYRIKEFIRQGFVLVNQKPVKKAGYLLKGGEEIIVKLTKSFQTKELKPINLSLDIIFEDDDILVINKPAGLLSCPTPEEKLKTLLNAVLPRLRKENFTDNDERLGLVHRLDKDTSGVMVMAKNQAAKDNLKEQFKKGQVEKTYLVLVRGKMQLQKGAIVAPLMHSKGRGSKMVIAPQGEGKESATLFKVLKNLGQATLLEVKPKTGRTHQIRVHLSSIGHSVVGDKVYGQKDQRMTLGRQFLHAWKIKFRHPTTKKFVCFESPLAFDLKEYLEGLMKTKIN